MKENIQISKNYAQALLESAGNDLSLQEFFLNELKEINSALGQVSDAKVVFDNPSISKNEKKQILTKIFKNKIQEKLLDFLFLIIEKNRFGCLAEIENQYLILLNKNRGIKTAEIVSSSELDAESLDKIKSKLENVFGKVIINSKIEPELIGGLKVKINDLVFDGSIKGRLEGLKRRLG